MRCVSFFLSQADMAKWYPPEISLRPLLLQHGHLFLVGCYVLVSSAVVRCQDVIIFMFFLFLHLKRWDNSPRPILPLHSAPSHLLYQLSSPQPPTSI